MGGPADGLVGRPVNRLLGGPTDGLLGRSTDRFESLQAGSGLK